MLLLPPRPEVCQECAVDHGPEEPHNAQSLYYQYWFRGQRGRWPTWWDAIQHCSQDVKAFWEQELRTLGGWTEPEDQVQDQGQGIDPGICDVAKEGHGAQQDRKGSDDGE